MWRETIDVYRTIIVTVSRLIKVHIPIGVAGEREIFSFVYGEQSSRSPNSGILILKLIKEIKEADVWKILIE